MTLWNTIAFWRQNNNSTYFCIMSVISGKGFSTQSLILSCTYSICFASAKNNPPMSSLSSHRFYYRDPHPSRAVELLRAGKLQHYLGRVEEAQRSFTQVCYPHRRHSWNRAFGYWLEFNLSSVIVDKKQCYLLVCWKHAVVVDSCPKSPLTTAWNAFYSVNIQWTTAFNDNLLSSSGLWHHEGDPWGGACPD